MFRLMKSLFVVHLDKIHAELMKSLIDVHCSFVFTCLVTMFQLVVLTT